MGERFHAFCCVNYCSSIRKHRVVAGYSNTHKDGVNLFKFPADISLRQENDFMHAVVSTTARVWEGVVLWLDAAILTKRE